MTTPAGWYPDPESTDQQRYWDGEQWTEHRAPLSGAAASADPSGATSPYASTEAIHDPMAPAPSTAKGSSRGKLLGGVAAGALVIAAGAFAATQLAGADGGADSPEAAVESLFEAIGEEDLVGMAESVLPGERRTFIDPALEGLGHLQRWGVLDEGFDTSDVSGVDIEVEQLDLRVEPVADDIVNVYASGTMSGEVEGEEIPLGDLVEDQIPEGESMSDLDAPRESADFDDVMMTAVREDGRWYVSGTFTIAEYARMETGADVPEGIAAIGADSPEAAVDGMIDAIESLQLEEILGRLNPDEAQALQRYAPLFIEEGQAEIDQAMQESGVEFSIDDVGYEVVRRDGIAVVQFTSFSISGSAPEEGEFEMTVDEDGCATMTIDGETEEICTEADAGSIDLTDTPMGDLEEMFADMDEIGLVVAERGGQWYISPIRSYSEVFLAVARVIDREDIDRFIEVIEDGSLEAWIEDELGTMFEEAFGISGEGSLFEELEGELEAEGVDALDETEDEGFVEELMAACGDGDMEACDELYWETPVGSDEEAFAKSCGDTLPPESGGTCVERTEGVAASTTVPGEAPAAGGTYGSDPELDVLWDACANGDGAACDDLYWASPIDSDYERFALTCGDRKPAEDLPSCEVTMGGS